MKIKSSLLALVLTCLCAFSGSVYATGGGYSSTMLAPTVSIKNQWYQKNFTVTNGTPSVGQIGTVYYTWNYSRAQAGLTVYLCTNSGLLCKDVSSAQTGSINYTSYNLAPNLVFSLKAMVTGTGVMVPLNGSQSQVIVNYTF